MDHISADGRISPWGEKRYRNARVTMEVGDGGVRAVFGGLKKAQNDWGGDVGEIKRPKIHWVRNTLDYQQLLSPKKKSGLWKPVVASVVAVVIVIILVAIFGRPPPQELSPYSHDWDDISSFKGEIESEGYATGTIISTPNILRNAKDIEPSKTAIFIVGVERRYSEDEVNTLIDFVNKGGRLLVADDFGYGNSIADSFKAHFLGGPLWDKNYIKNPKFVQVVVNPTTGFYFSGNIVLNQGTGLESTDEYLVLAQSSESSWVDLNGNGEFDPGFEHYQAYKVAITANVGDGKIVLISDPSIFINDMVNKGDNLEFTKHLTRYLLPEGGKVVFDESSHIEGDAVSTVARDYYYVLGWLTTNTILLAFLFIALLLIFGLILINSEMPPTLLHRHIADEMILPKELNMPMGMGLDDEGLLRDILRKAVILHNGIEMDADDSTVAEHLKDRGLREFLLGKKSGLSNQEIQAILVYASRGQFRIDDVGGHYKT